MTPVPGCRIEISYIDPETYASVVNHQMRKDILRTLYRMALDGPVSKQKLADELGLDYHQLVYQLNNQLREFWIVLEEQKKRGTRMELIGPSHPYSIMISIGKDQRLHIFDPLANIFGPMSKAGTRCDKCSPKEVERCLSYVSSGCGCSKDLSPAEKQLLQVNGRSGTPRPLDKAILCALSGIAEGKSCVISIPCEGCAFLKRTIKIQ